VELLTEVSGAQAAGARPGVAFACDVDEGVLRVSGPVDPDSVDVLRSALKRASLGGVRSLVVDLDGVTHLASIGVQALVEAMTAAGVSRPDDTPGIRLLAPFGSPAQHVLELVGLPYHTRLERPET
jgi:ABC-type transporter Mla MlaB component